MASLTFDALWRDRGVVNGLKALATQAEKTKTGFDRLGSATGVFKRLGASSAQASRAGMSIGTNLQRGILRPMAGLPGIIAGLVGGAVVMGAKRLATEASDMNETVSKTRTIFGTSSKAIESWAKGAARNLGMSRQEALTGASAFGNLFDQLGFGVKQATAMSKGFVQMATDAASFSNANPAEVMDAFQAATRGEYDALQKYIPTVSAATIQAEAMRMTHKKSASDLTAADKAAALYQVSVKGLGKAHGDFARTSGGFANQQRIMAANWADLRVKIGTYFLPVFTKAAKYMNEEGFPALTRIVDVLGTVGGAAARMGRAVTKSLSGTFGPAIDAATVNLTELADWFETHQAGMIRFFIGVGDAAFAVGRGIARFVSGTIRSFGTLTGGLADMLDNMAPFAVKVLDTVIAIENALGHDTKALRDARDNMGPMLGETSKGLRDARTRANETADAFDRRVFPALTRAQGAMHRVGAEEIWKAKQRDAAARASQAIRDIGTKADGSQIKLKSWNERTRLGAVEQARLEGRLKAARQRMDEQRAAGIRAGESQKTLTTRWNQGRAALEREFRQMGLSKEEARKLAVRYSQIPKKVQTPVTQPGMRAARLDTWDLDKRINNLNNKKVSVTFETNAKKFGLTATELNAARRGMRAGGPVQNLSGRGRAGVDTEPILGEVGEHMLTRADVRAMGGQGGVMDFRRALHMAAGGPVRRSIEASVGHLGPTPNFDKIGDYIARRVGNKIGKGLLPLLGSGGLGPGAVGNPHGYARFHGGLFTKLAAANLRQAERFAGVPFRVMQGGWRPATSYSGTSHAGDAVDTQNDARVIRAIRRVGWASGNRAGLGNWAPHAHSVPGPGRGYARGSATWQYQDYLRRGGARQGLRSPWGLASGGLLTARVAEKGPERLLSAKDTRSYERMVSLASRNGVGGVTYQVTVNAPNYVGANQDLVNTMVQMGKRGQMDVVLRSAGVRV